MQKAIHVLIIGKTWEPPKFPFTGKWMNNDHRLDHGNMGSHGKAKQMNYNTQYRR